MALDTQFRTTDVQARLNGETGLKLSDFQLKRATALAGAIKVKDNPKLSFDLVGREESGS